MLGFHVSVYRQADGGAAPATEKSREGTRLAVWQTGLGGLGWLEELTKAGKALVLSRTGYPTRYTGTAEHIIPGFATEARDTWVSGPSDVLTAKWDGQTVTDAAAVAACAPGEWLLVEAWDES